MPSNGQFVTVSGQTYSAVSRWGQLRAVSIVTSLNVKIASDSAACASCFW